MSINSAAPQSCVVIPSFDDTLDGCDEEITTHKRTIGKDLVDPVDLKRLFGIGRGKVEQSHSSVSELPAEIKNIFELHEVPQKVDSGHDSSVYSDSDKYSHFCDGFSEKPQLDDASIIMFIESVIATPELTESLKSLLDKRPESKELARNPFILRLLCWSWNKVQYLPESKRELFDRFFRMLFCSDLFVIISLDAELCKLGRLSLPTLMMKTPLPVEFYKILRELGIWVLDTYFAFSPDCSREKPFSSRFIEFDYCESAIEVAEHSCVLEYYAAKYLESLLENTNKEIHTSVYKQEQVVIFSNIFTFINNEDILEKAIQFGHWNSLGFLDFSVDNPFYIKIRNLQELRTSTIEHSNTTTQFQLETNFDPTETAIRSSKNPFNNVMLEEGVIIGTGSLDKVYKCHVRDDVDKIYAVKQILRNKACSVSELVALNRMQKLPKHPNIVTIFRTFQTNLEQFLDQEGIQAEVTAVRVARDVASGLQFLHHHEIAHFELKTSHVLVDSSVDLNRFKISGFSPREGEANERADIAYSILGDCHFMAPEIFLAPERGFGPKSDCWSLGCIIVHMVTGSVPFSQWALFKVAYSMGENKLSPQYTSYLDSSTKSELVVRILQHLLVFNPNERYSAGQILELVADSIGELSGSRAVSIVAEDNHLHGLPPITECDETVDIAVEVADIETEYQINSVLLTRPHSHQVVKPWNRLLLKLLSLVPFFSPRSTEYPEMFVLAGNPTQMRRYGLVRQERVDIVQYNPDQLPSQQNNRLTSTNEEPTSFLLQSPSTTSAERSNNNVNGRQIEGCATGLCADLDSLVRKNSGSSFLVDTALFTVNFSRLLAVLKIGKKHEYFELIIILLSISIGLQFAIAIILIWNDRRNVNHSNAQTQNKVSRCVTLLMTISVLLNIVNIMSEIVDGQNNGVKDKQEVAELPGSSRF